LLEITSVNVELEVLSSLVDELVVELVALELAVEPACVDRP
jgi:hypothetical protein